MSRPWLFPDVLFNLFGYGNIQQQYLDVVHGQSNAAINRRRRQYMLEKELDEKSITDDGVIDI